MKPRGIVHYFLPVLVIFAWIIDVSFGAVSGVPYGSNLFLFDSINGKKYDRFIKCFINIAKYYMNINKIIMLYIYMNIYI